MRRSEVVRKYPDEYLECRTFRHAWRREATGVARDLGLRTEFENCPALVLVCIRCEMRRVDVFPIGARPEPWRRIARTYHQPEHYQIPAIVLDAPKDRPSLEDWRQELWRRSTGVGE